MTELLGTHSYQLDPKGRISLPARFREAFADGAVLTLTGKFGVGVEETASLVRTARTYAREVGITFHVGSQCVDTGAFGRAIALELARAGASVLVHARRYSMAILTTSRRFESASRRAASTSPCSTQRTASSCSSSREIGGCWRSSL